MGNDLSTELQRLLPKCLDSELSNIATIQEDTRLPRSSGGVAEQFHPRSSKYKHLDQERVGIEATCAKDASDKIPGALNWAQPVESLAPASHTSAYMCSEKHWKQPGEVPSDDLGAL